MWCIFCYNHQCFTNCYHVVCYWFIKIMCINPAYPYVLCFYYVMYVEIWTLCNWDISLKSKLCSHNATSMIMHTIEEDLWDISKETTCSWHVFGPLYSYFVEIWTCLKLILRHFIKIQALLKMHHAYHKGNLRNISLVTTSSMSFAHCVLILWKYRLAITEISH